MTVHCGTCNHEWELAFKLPMPIGRFVEAARGAAAAGCPRCGAFGKSVICGKALAEQSP